MTGKEAISYIENVPWQGTRLGLERTQELLAKLGNPEKQLRFVHVAGTNGKGSTASMTASVLRQAGYVTGLYISPFLQVFNERMSVNGANITDEELGELTERVQAIAEAMEDAPTEFEMMTAIAMLFFVKRQCDIVVLEVGMGGRLDSTNVIEAPEAAVICNIGLDHVKELGDTVEKIAYEKAGIIKRGSDAVLYQPSETGVEAVIRQVCQEHQVPLHIADFSRIAVLEDTIGGQTFSYKTYHDLHLQLLGSHQLRNAAVVVETIEVLRNRGYQISDEALQKGLAQTSWPGRFEVLHEAPVFIADGGHNRQCAEAVKDALKTYFPQKEILLIIGVLADKDYRAMIDLLVPMAKRIYTVTPDSPRALRAADLAKQLSCYEKPTDVCSGAAEAVAKAFADAREDDVICSVGSLYMIGEIRSAVLSENN